jgi:hypothetical protein
VSVLLAASGSGRRRARRRQSPGRS